MRFTFLLLIAIFAIISHPISGAQESCVWGAPGAPVVIEVFSDFQCPACGQFYRETVRPLRAEYAAKGGVCLRYEEFPLSFHQHARRAARYSVAAGRLSPAVRTLVIDALYSRQGEWTENGDFEKVLSSVVPLPTWRQLAALASDPALDQEIDRDLAAGKSRGARGTPAVFLTAQGRRHRIPSTVQYEILRRYVDHLLEP